MRVFKKNQIDDRPDRPLLTIIAFGAISAVLLAFLKTMLENDFSSITAGILFIVWIMGVFLWVVLYARIIRNLFIPFRSFPSVD